MGDYSELKGHDPAGEEAVDAGKGPVVEEVSVVEPTPPKPVSPKSDS